MFIVIEIQTMADGGQQVGWTFYRHPAEEPEE